MAQYRHITAVPPASAARPTAGRVSLFHQTISGAGPVVPTTSVPWRVPWASTLQQVNVRVGTADPAGEDYVILKNGLTVLTLTLPGTQVFASLACSIPFDGNVDEVSVQTPTTTAVGVNVDLLFMGTG